MLGQGVSTPFLSVAGHDKRPWAVITRNYTQQGLSIVLETEKPEEKEPIGSVAC